MSLGAANTATSVGEGIAWLAVAVSLTVDLVRRKPHGLHVRLMLAGLLVIFTGAFFSQFAAVRQWPHSQRLAVDAMTLVLWVAGGACVVASIVARAKSQSPQS